MKITICVKNYYDTTLQNKTIRKKRIFSTKMRTKNNNVNNRFIKFTKVFNLFYINFQRIKSYYIFHYDIVSIVINAHYSF